MKSEFVQYGIIGTAILLLAGVAAVYAWPDKKVEPLDPPEIVAERLEQSDSTDVKVRAAHDFIRHGERARVQVRQALASHANYEPEVVAPLLQATMKNRDLASAPTVIALLEHPDPKVRGRAGAAVRKILGADFGFRANDPPEKRRKIVKIIKDDFEFGQAHLQEIYRDQK